MTEEEKTTYLVEFVNDTKKKITVPSNWKVTFGPIVRSATSNPTSERWREKNPVALRFYEHDTRQRAIFTGVKSFRDMSIKIEEERITTQNKVGSIDIEGAKKNVNIKAETREWVNPDDLDEVNDPKRLVADENILDVSIEDFEIKD